jgi:hypothetical protein
LLLYTNPTDPIIGEIHAVEIVDADAAARVRFGKGADPQPVFIGEVFEAEEGDGLDLVQLTAGQAKLRIFGPLSRVKCANGPSSPTTTSLSKQAVTIFDSAGNALNAGAIGGFGNVFPAGVVHAADGSFVTFPSATLRGGGYRISPNLFLQEDNAGVATPVRDWRGASGGLSGTIDNGASAVAGVGLVCPPGQATLVSTPAAATQAIVGLGAGGINQRWICTGIFGSIATGANASGIMTLQLLDGAAVIWAEDLQCPINSIDRINLVDLWLPGSLNTGMTLRFAAAGPVGSLEKVTLTYCFVT